MKVKEHSLFIAYIVCLFLCIIMRILDVLVPDYSFVAWSKVAVAATVSTVYFCIADAIQTKREIHNIIDQEVTGLENKQNELFLRLKHVFDMKLNDGGNLIQDKERAIQRIKDKIIMLPGDKQKQRTDYVFLFNSCGFLTFLLVLVFDFFYRVFYPVQDLLTMIAFVIVLLTVLYRETELQKAYDILQKNRSNIDKLDLTMSVIEIYENKMEEKNDGTDENADK